MGDDKNWDAATSRHDSVMMLLTQPNDKRYLCYEIYTILSYYTNFSTRMPLM